MIRIGLAAFLAAFAAAAAHAQQTFEPAVPRGLSDTTVQPSGELGPSQQTQTFTRSEDSVPQLVMLSPRHAHDADARQCLRLANNRQIHRCAERYRPHIAQAELTKTKAPATAAGGGVERGYKADLSKAAEPAKPIEGKLVTPAAAAPPAKAAQAPAASGSK
jgi:hypothetical protein